MTRRIALLTVYLLAALPVRAQIVSVKDQTASSATVDLLVTGTDADSTTVESDSGLEIIGTKLTLIRGCADNEILKWDETEDDWNCEADADSGLWTDGTNGWYANTEAVIVGADAAFDADGADGGAGDLKVSDDIEIVGEIWFGEGGPATTHKITVATADASDDEIIQIGGDDQTRGGSIVIQGNDVPIGGAGGRVIVTAGDDADGDITLQTLTAGQSVEVAVEAGATDTTYLFADQFTMTSDGTGDGEFTVPDDSIGPDEVLAAGQSDGFLLTYELTGDTWSWTDPSTITGSSPWTDTGTHIEQVTTGDEITIGSTSNDSTVKVEIYADTTTQRPLVLRAASGNTVDPLLVNEVGGSSLFKVNVAGGSTHYGDVITTTGFDGLGAVDLDYGSADITDHTFITDGTGDGEIVLPDDSIGLAEIAFDHGDLPGLTDDDHALYLNTTADDTYSEATWLVSASTSDASDTSYMAILGGGGSTLNLNRGAFVLVSGNEQATYGGGIQIQAGNPAGADIDIKTNDATGAATITLEHADSGGNQSLVIDGGGFTLNGGAATDTLELLDGIGFVMEGSTSGTITHEVPATVTTHTLTWPSAQGGASTVLTNNGSGTLSWSTPSGGTVLPRELLFDSASLYCSEALNCAVTAYDNNTNVDNLGLAFDDATDEFSNGRFVVPDAVSTTGSDTVEFSVWFTASADGCSATCTTYWDFRWAVASSGEVFDDAYTTEADGGCAANTDSETVVECTWTESLTNLGWTAGELVHFQVVRDADNGSDNLAQDAWLKMFRISIPQE